MEKVTTLVTGIRNMVIFFLCPTLVTRRKTFFSNFNKINNSSFQCSNCDYATHASPTHHLKHMFYIGLSEVVPSPPLQGETEGGRVRLHIGLLYIVLLFHLSD